MKFCYGVILTLLFVFDDSHADVSVCCKQGYQRGLKVTTEDITCKEDDVDYSGIPVADRMTCAVVFIRCCNAAAERELCTEGLSVAMSGLSCAARTGPGGLVQKQCCDCCYQGVRQARNKGDCNVKQETMFCSEAFSVCCRNSAIAVTSAPSTNKKASPGQIQTVPTVASTRPTTKPKPTTVAAPTCETLTCAHACHYVGDTAKCLCRNGYRLGADQQTCEDIDECKEKTASCNKNQICKNTEGSYTCDVDKSVTKCTRGGYRPGKDGKCHDEDECKNGQNSCHDDQLCLNTDGSYICLVSCPYGYQKVGKRCEDIDECKTAGKKCPNRFKCVNDVGSYSCKRESCEPGYELSDGQCYDINECEANKNICGEGGRCFNQYGSFYCVCNTGYTRDLVTKKCVDLNECQRQQYICSYRCVNTKGSYTCQCPRGFTTVGEKCIDIDECASINPPCPTGFSCHNTHGRFACIKTACPNSFYVQRSKYECSLYCPRTDACKHILEQSIKWKAYSFSKTLEKANFVFTYFVRINSYLSTTIRFYLASGNENNEFFVEKLSKESVKIYNARRLIGPREYTLRLHADVVYNGKTTTRFVYFFYLYLSDYDF